MGRDGVHMFSCVDVSCMVRIRCYSKISQIPGEEQFMPPFFKKKKRQRWDGGRSALGTLAYF